jgi:hypothetical protein
MSLQLSPQQKSEVIDFSMYIILKSQEAKQITAKYKNWLQVQNQGIFKSSVGKKNPQTLY